MYHHVGLKLRLPLSCGWLLLLWSLLLLLWSLLLLLWRRWLRPLLQLWLLLRRRRRRLWCYVQEPPHQIPHDGRGLGRQPKLRLCLLLLRLLLLLHLLPLLRRCLLLCLLLLLHLLRVGL